MKIDELTGMVTTFNGWTYESYYAYLQHRFNMQQLNLPSNLPKLNDSLRTDTERGRGHTSARGDEFGGLPAGFCTGKDVA